MNCSTGQLATALLRAVLGVAVLVPAARGASGAERLYAPCVVCHQPNAWGSADGAIPNLAGQQPRYLEQQLTLFRSGARVDTAMNLVAEHPKFADRNNIVALAAYLSALEPNPNPVKGSGEHLRLGQEVFMHICAACHGFDGRGNAANRVPRIAGQHYPYLRRQIEAAASLHKDLTPPEMNAALRGMPDPEKDAVADYIARLGGGDPPLEPGRPIPR